MMNVGSTALEAIDEDVWETFYTAKHIFVLCLPNHISKMFNVLS